MSRYGAETVKLCTMSLLCRSACVNLYEALHVTSCPTAKVRGLVKTPHCTPDVMCAGAVTATFFNATLLWERSWMEKVTREPAAHARQLK
jgi:hypothetical protein